MLKHTSTISQHSQNCCQDGVLMHHFIPCTPSQSLWLFSLHLSNPLMQECFKSQCSVIFLFSQLVLYMISSIQSVFLFNSPLNLVVVFPTVLNTSKYLPNISNLISSKKSWKLSPSLPKLTLLLVLLIAIHSNLIHPWLFCTLIPYI